MKNHDEIAALQDENKRLRKIISALMNGYTTIGEANLLPVKLHFGSSVQIF